MRDVRGKRENAAIYIYIYRAQKWGQRSDITHSGNDTWRSGDNEATPSIQRMTRGDTVGICNRRNSVSKMMRAAQKLTCGISFGRRDVYRRSASDFATRGSQRPM